MLDAATAQTLREIVANGAMPPLVLVVDDCCAAYDRMGARGDPSLLRSMVSTGIGSWTWSCKWGMAITWLSLSANWLAA